MFDAASRRVPFSSSKPTMPVFRSSGSAPGTCAARPARGWSRRRSRSAIATSIPLRCTATRKRWARASAPRASSATKSSSPPRSGRATSRRAISSAPTQDSLAKLKLPYVDLLLIHWPNPSIPLPGTIGALCKMKREGLARHVGVSNFTVALIDEAVKLATEPLVCNQIECHPFSTRRRRSRRAARPAWR